MKIDANRDLRPATDPTRVDADRTTTAGPSGAKATPVNDQVTLSPDVQLAQAAMKAAENAPDIRPDAVARAKALLEQGQVGTNLDSLAASILDSLTRPKP